MTEKLTLARPYAKAGFRYALEKNCINSWSDKLNVLFQVANDQAVKKILAHPEYTQEKKADFVSGFIAEFVKDEDKHFGNFLKIIANYNRLELLPEIAAVFDKLKLRHNREDNISVTLAMPATSKQEEEIKALLVKKNPDNKINVIFDVDSSLIGGLVIRKGDKTIDGSVKGQLRKLAEELIK